MTFPKIGSRTAYSVALENSRPVIKAEADRSASMLVWEQEFDPREFPLVEWSWRVQGPLAGADLERKEADDSPARVIVMFPEEPGADHSGESWRRRLLRMVYGDSLPSHGLGYVAAPTDSAWMRSSVTRRMRLLPLAIQPTQWQTFRRDLVADYAGAFGGELPARALLAVMVDTDDTRQRTVSAFAGLRLLRR